MADDFPKIKGDSDDGIPSNRSTYQSRIVTILLGLAVRLVAYLYLDGFFNSSPQLVTPASSFKRFKEGVYLYESGITDPYDGDMFHVMPIFIYFVKPFLDSPIALRLLWTFLDLLSAYFIGQFVKSYVTAKTNNLPQARRLQNFAMIGYLLNPMTIGCWTVMSISSITNTLLAGFIYFTVKSNLPLAILCVALASHLNVYYIVLLASIFAAFKDRLLVFLLAAVTFIVLFSANLRLAASPRKLVHSTIGFSFSVPDLTPNCGLFWYFFAQVFEHYQLLFLFAFQLNAFIYVMPLAITFRQNPHFLSVLLMMLVAIFSSYPSYAETAIYLPLFFAFVDFHKYVRYALITGGTIVTSTVLAPIMWRMWVVTGTGNANFFFAIIWVYNLAQIFLFSDVASAYLRAKMVKSNALEKEEDKIEAIKLIDSNIL